MAKIKLGPTVVGIRGTIGGVTFSANGSGTYAKQWASGPNPKSPLQTSQRSRVSAQAIAWRALSVAQQLAWDTFAALPAQDQTDSLGQTYSLSGFGWFVKVNVRLLVMGRAPRIPPPVIARPAAPTITNLRAASTPSIQDTLINYPPATFAGFDMVIKIHFAPSVGQAVRAAGFKLVVSTTTPGNSQQVFQTECETAFGIIFLNSNALCEVYRQTTDGLRSSRTFLTDLVNI